MFFNRLKFGFFWQFIERLAREEDCISGHGVACFPLSTMKHTVLHGSDLVPD